MATENRQSSSPVKMVSPRSMALSLRSQTKSDKSQEMEISSDTNSISSIQSSKRHQGCEQIEDVEAVRTERSSPLSARALKDDHRRNVVFDINSMPSSRLLSEREKKLCASMKLRPSHYISIKGLILKVTDSFNSINRIDLYRAFFKLSISFFRTVH